MLIGIKINAFLLFFLLTWSKMLVVFFPVPADFVYMYCTQPPARCCQLSTIFFCRPIQKKARAIQKKKEKKERKIFYFLNNTQCNTFGARINQNHLTYVYKKSGVHRAGSKVKLTGRWWLQNLILRHNYKIGFSFFLSRFFRIWLQS